MTNINKAFFFIATIALFTFKTYAQTLPITDFTRPSEISSASLSPDGKHIALSVPSVDGLETSLSIINLEDSKDVRELKFGKRQHVADVIWTSNDQITVSRAEMDPLLAQPISRGEIFSSKIDGSNQAELFAFSGGKRKDEGFAEVVYVIDSEPGMALISFQCWTCNEDQNTLTYKVNTVTGERKLVGRLPGRSTAIYDQNGEAKLSIGFNDSDVPVTNYRTDSNAKWQSVPKNLVGYSMDFGFYAQDNKNLYAAISDKGEPSKLYQINLETLTRTFVAGNDDLDISQVLLGGRARIPFAIFYAGSKPKIEYIDKTSKWAQLHAGLLKAFPGELIDFVDFSSDDNIVLFSVYSDRHPGAYYLLNRQTKIIKMIGETKPWVKPENMASTKPIEFQSRHGEKLFGLLTTLGSGAKPLIVIPHGGPYGISDKWGYDSEVQFFANRGYAVLQVNFRGSGGRGFNFEKLGWREWGGKIQDDIADGVLWANNNGYSNTGKACIYGASFGGYSALMNPIKFPDLYKCAIGYVGAYDLQLMYKRGDITNSKSGDRYLERVLGTDAAELAAYSPARNASKVKIPVMLIHGKMDNRVPIYHYNEMRDALIKNGNTPESFVIANEGHGFYEQKNVNELYRRVEVFLNKSLTK